MEQLDLVGRRLQEVADQVEREKEKYEELLACAEMRRDHPDAQTISRNPVP